MSKYLGENAYLSPFLVAPACLAGAMRRRKLFEGGNQRGGLGNLSAVGSRLAVALCEGWLPKVEAHQLFGGQLPKLLDELNAVLAA